jgi:membrane-bound lytic murein transglycosylase D
VTSRLSPPARVSRPLRRLAVWLTVMTMLAALSSLSCGPKPESGRLEQPGSEEVSVAESAGSAAGTASGTGPAGAGSNGRYSPGGSGSSLIASAEGMAGEHGAVDVSVDELLAAAETALVDAEVRAAAGDEEGYRQAIAEALSYLDEAMKRVSADPATFPLLKGTYAKLLAQLRDSLDPTEMQEDVLGASPAELAGTREAKYANSVTYEMPIDHDAKLVQKYLALFQRGKRRAYIQSSFERSGRYREFVMEEIQKRGLPEELWVVPIIESGYKTSAYSRTRAVGIWQFMAGTARNYGLTVNEWVDERRDPVKSTRAALDYLKDLYLWFNNWDFALAAYNRGEFGIQRDIKNSGIVDFMEMAELGATHRETRNHVPQIHAAAIIAKNPEKYGFTFSFEEPVEADTVHIDYVIDLEVAAQCAGTTEKRLRALNPELRSWVTPLLSRDYPTYALKIPVGARERFVGQVASVPDLTPKRQVTYVVRRGDTLGSIARRFGVSWKKIQGWNNLRSSRIYPGQKLVILPGRSGASAAAMASAGSGSSGSRSSSSRSRSYSSTQVTDGGESYRIYTVRRGDTLTHIAQAFGVTVNELKRWNGVGSRIYPGQKLKIKGEGASASASPSEMTSEPMVYVVKKGDTLSQIAQRHHTTVSRLRSWNELGRYLYPGQKLKIYGD